MPHVTCAPSATTIDSLDISILEERGLIKRAPKRNHSCLEPEDEDLLDELQQYRPTAKVFFFTEAIEKLIRSWHPSAPKLSIRWIVKWWKFCGGRLVGQTGAA